MDAYGRQVVLSEKTSATITVLMVLTIFGTIGMFALSILSVQRSAAVAGAGVLGALAMLTYVFILNHLRRKGDMNVSYAVFKGPYGVVEVRKKSSIWLTLALGLAILSAVGSLALIAYGAILGTRGGGLLAASGIAGLIGSAFYAAALNFLRTKLDMPVDRAVIVSAGGQYLELRKSKSILITLGLIMTVLAAVGAFGLGALILVGGLTGFGLSTSTYALTAPATISGGAMIFLGLMLLVGAAVLNFLKVRVHVTPLQGYVAPPYPQPQQQYPQAYPPR